MIEITLSMVTSLREIEPIWRELETHSDASFFQSWAWTGCLLEERFPDPVLLRARIGDRIVALALFNASCSASTLCLGESGDRRYDDIFIEHNGFLIEHGQPDLLVRCIEAAGTAPIMNAPSRRERLVRLSGVDERYLTALQGSSASVQLRATHEAPFIDLEALKCSGETPLSVLSRNTRYQIRRSERAYAHMGSLSIRRATSEPEAQSFLTALAELHQSYWRGRGREGAFANPRFERFHRQLISRAFPTGGTDLLRVTAGTKAIGYLYNFSYQGRVFAYQSGFDYRLSSSHQKPGLTCHHLALEMYLAEGARIYDFLAGADRYKLSLSTSTVRLYWLDYGRFGMWRKVRQRLSRGLIGRR